MNICPFLCPLSKGSLNRTTAKYEELGIKCLLLRLQGCPEHAGQFSKIPTRAHPPHPEQSPSPAPLLHSCGDEWRDDSAVAEMTGTQLLITCLLLNTLNSHFPTALRSPCPHSRFSAAVSSAQQLMGPNEHLALAPSYPCSTTHLSLGYHNYDFVLLFTLDQIIKHVCFYACDKSSTICTSATFSGAMTQEQYLCSSHSTQLSYRCQKYLRPQSTRDIYRIQ